MNVVGACIVHCSLAKRKKELEHIVVQFIGFTASEPVSNLEIINGNSMTAIMHTNIPEPAILASPI